MNLAALLAIAGCATSVEPPAPAWFDVDAETGQLSAIDDLVALAERFPESAGVQLRLLNSAHRGGRSDLVRETMMRLGDMGYALSPASLQALAVHLPADELASVTTRMAENRQELRASAVFSAVPAAHRLVEGLAWDRRTNRLFAGSVVGRELVMLGGQGWRTIEGLDPGSLFGLAIDEPRRLLWMGSGVVEPTPAPETAFRGLIAVSLDDLRMVRRVATPSPHLSPSDIAVARDGSVYASDPVSGALLVARPGAMQMEVLVPSGTLRSPQGIAIAENRGRLYIADYSYGVAMIDIATGAVSRLAADVPMMLSGIDGLLFFEGDLVAIQNGTSPRRIVRIRLDPSGTRATGLSVIERGHAEWGEPTLAQVKEGDLLYVADAQWDRFAAGGTITGAEPLRPTTIRIVPLREGREPPPR